MAKGSPSLLALLGLAAVAGYQNKDRIRDWLDDRSAAQGQPGYAAQTGGGWLDGLLAGVGGAAGGGGLRGTLADGVRDVVDRFRSAGHAVPADSWVSTGQNKSVRADELRDAVGQDVLADLARQSGLSEDDLLERLRHALPEIVDRMTPDGRLPDSGPPGSRMI